MVTYRRIRRRRRDGIIQRYKIKKYGGYTIKHVGTDVLKDYLGMNHYAGKAMGFVPNPRPNEILVLKDSNRRLRAETAKHEVIEADLMKKKKMSYWDAHVVALKKEKIGRNERHSHFTF